MKRQKIRRLSSEEWLKKGRNKWNESWAGWAKDSGGDLSFLQQVQWIPALAVILGEVQLGKERSEVWSHLESPLVPQSCRTPALIFPSSTVHDVFQLSQLHGELQLVSFQLSSFQRLNFQRLWNSRDWISRDYEIPEIEFPAIMNFQSLARKAEDGLSSRGEHLHREIWMRWAQALSFVRKFQAETTVLMWILGQDLVPKSENWGLLGRRSQGWSHSLSSLWLSRDMLCLGGSHSIPSIKKNYFGENFSQFLRWTEPGQAQQSIFSQLPSRRGRQMRQSSAVTGAALLWHNKEIAEEKRWAQ